MSNVTESEFKEIHRLVWQFRRMVADYWPAPEPLDALRYAFTEAGEAIDALLREQRPGDRRNRPSEVVQADRLDEWADCAIMLITALPGYEGEWSIYPRRSEEAIASYVGWNMYMATISTDDPLETAALIGSIANLPGMDLRQRVLARLQRIAQRHVTSMFYNESHIVIQVREFFANAGGAMSQQTPSHQEKIVCPECGAVQVANVLHTVPWASYVHNCDQCGCIISETERLAAAREETQRENAELREAIKRLQENTAARNPGRAQ